MRSTWDHYYQPNWQSWSVVDTAAAAAVAVAAAVVAAAAKAEI